jgi:hypothetical protein
MSIFNPSDAIAPCDHPFPDWKPHDRKLTQLLSLIQLILDKAEDIFG